MWLEQNALTRASISISVVNAYTESFANHGLLSHTLVYFTLKSVRCATQSNITEWDSVIVSTKIWTLR